MNFKNKYLKYKRKYLDLKKENQIGGMFNNKRNTSVAATSSKPSSRKIPNFSKNNIEEINISGLEELSMFKYIHYSGMKSNFTADEILQDNYDKTGIDYDKIIYVAYVLTQDSYDILKGIAQELIQNISLQNHFHMTIGFYLVRYPQSPPNIDIANLPDIINCNVENILKTKDNGILLSSISIDDEIKSMLNSLGVDFTNKHLHLTLGTKLPYKHFHSNSVLENWNK